MPEQWTHVRLKTATVAALKQYRQECMDSPRSGAPMLDTGGRPGDETPSIDAVVCRLLALVDAHRTRAKRSRRSRRAAELSALVDDTARDVLAAAPGPDDVVARCAAIDRALDLAEAAERLRTDFA